MTLAGLGAHEGADEHRVRVGKARLAPRGLELLGVETAGVDARHRDGVRRAPCCGPVGDEGGARDVERAEGAQIPRASPALEEARCVRSFEQRRDRREARLEVRGAGGEARVGIRVCVQHPSLARDGEIREPAGALRRGGVEQPEEVDRGGGREEVTIHVEGAARQHQLVGRPVHALVPHELDDRAGASRDALVGEEVKGAGRESS